MIIECDGEDEETILLSVSGLNEMGKDKEGVLNIVHKRIAI